MLMLAGDSGEPVVTKLPPGVDNKTVAMLIKLVIGYPSGVVGGTEVTPISPVTCD